MERKDKELEELRRTLAQQSALLSQMKSQIEKPVNKDAEKSELLKANQQYEAALKSMQENMKILQKNQTTLQENLKQQQEFNKKNQKSSSCNVF